MLVNNSPGTQNSVYAILDIFSFDGNSQDSFPLMWFEI